MSQITNKYTNFDIDVDSAIKKYKPYMYERYFNVVVQDMMKKFKLKNIHQVPKISKIIISSAISYKQHKLDFLYKIFNCLYLMTGQKPVYTLASRSISQFKIYKKCIIGAKVALTNKIMIYEFIERLTHIYLPSIKNFDGLKISSLSKNSYNLGIKDVHIVPEINQYIGMDNFGLTITIIMDMHKFNKEMALHLLNALDIPIYN
jgi:large subunit ribosomal protein L5